MIAVIIGRYAGVGVLTLSLIFSIINPYLAVGLIIAVLVGSNIALRLVARLDRLETILYVVYVLVGIGLAGLWLSSIISAVQALFIFVPVLVCYCIFSWTRIGRR